MTKVCKGYLREGPENVLAGRSGSGGGLDRVVTDLWRSERVSAISVCFFAVRIEPAEQVPLSADTHSKRSGFQRNHQIAYNINVGGEHRYHFQQKTAMGRIGASVHGLSDDSSTRLLGQTPLPTR